MVWVKDISGSLIGGYSSTSASGKTILNCAVDEDVMISIVIGNN